LLIGSDHEDDITNQGSDDAGVANLLILGPNYEDEDGDNENHSSSVYLNFNQDDARNVEHEGDENEEDERNHKQSLVGALSASQVRRGRGPNKLTSGHFVIMAVNEVGDRTQSSVLVNA
jgi:hypothetical protein